VKPVVRATGSTMRIRYGPADDHEGDLHLPATRRAPAVCLLHGGFWRMPHGRDQMDAIADDLVARGFAVWNLEYRRLGSAGTVWPAPMNDAAAGVEHLARLAADGADIDLDRVVVVGHSAGGHLALWVGARNGSRHVESARVRVLAAAGLAPITDLASAYEARLGGEVVAELLGGTPNEYPDRCRVSSPIEMVPLGLRQAIVHGTADAEVPIEQSRRYARAASAAGDIVELIELEGTGHLEFLDPASAAHAALCRWLIATTGTDGRA
jgi:acetyl esterase/lipase